MSGTILFALNYRRMGNPDAAKLSLAIGLLVWCGTVVLLAFLPEPILDAVPNAIIPVLFGTFGVIMVEKYQTDAIKAHLEAGGRKGSVLAVLGAVLVGTASVLPFVLLPSGVSSLETGTGSEIEDVIE